MGINQKIDKTVDWLREKVKEAGCKGLVVGVSGGIDSAVVCYLIKKAFPDNSIGVIMSINSNPKDREDALKVINGCGIDYIDLDLTTPQEMILNSVTSALKEKNLYNEDGLRASDSNLHTQLTRQMVYLLLHSILPRLLPKLQEYHHSESI